MSTDTLSKIKNNIVLISIVLAVVLGAVLIFIVNPAYKAAGDIGSGAGETAGKLCGNIAGSFEGLTEGHAAGEADGTAEALEAKDTEAYIGGRVREKKVLEVLEVNMKECVDTSMDGGNVYALQVLECTATYSVDLGQAEIQIDGNNVNVYIPAPEFTTSDEKTEVIETYEKKKNAGSTANGITGTLNSEKNIRESVNEKLQNDEDLTQKAESAALNQVEIFINNILVDKNKIVTVSFKEGTENAGN